jgi:CRISPR-associated protein Cas2
MVKYLEAYGSRVQKSAFEALLPERKYKVMVKGIAKIITNEDNVRIYRLNSSNEIVLLGTGDTIYEENVIII